MRSTHLQLQKSIEKLLKMMLILLSGEFLLFPLLFPYSYSILTFYSIKEEKNDYVQLDPALERFANAKSFGSSDFRREGDDVREYKSNFNLLNCCNIL
jgi:hypothetical protein